MRPERPRFDRSRRRRRAARRSAHGSGPRSAAAGRSPARPSGSSRDGLADLPDVVDRLGRLAGSRPAPGRPARTDSSGSAPTQRLAAVDVDRDSPRDRRQPRRPARAARRSSAPRATPSRTSAGSPPRPAPGRRAPCRRPRTRAARTTGRPRGRRRDRPRRKRARRSRSSTAGRYQRLGDPRITLRRSTPGPDRAPARRARRCRTVVAACSRSDRASRSSGGPRRSAHDRCASRSRRARRGSPRRSSAGNATRRPRRAAPRSTGCGARRRRRRRPPRSASAGSPPPTGRDVSATGSTRDSAAGGRARRPGADRLAHGLRVQGASTVGSCAVHAMQRSARGLATGPPHSGQLPRAQVVVHGRDRHPELLGDRADRVSVGGQPPCRLDALGDRSSKVSRRADRPGCLQRLAPRAEMRGHARAARPARMLAHPLALSRRGRRRAARRTSPDAAADPPVSSDPAAQRGQDRVAVPAARPSRVAHRGVAR